MRRALLVSLVALCPDSVVCGGDSVPHAFPRALAIGQVGRGGRTPIRFDAVEHRIVTGTFAAPSVGDTVTSPDGTVREWTFIDSKEGRFESPILGGGYAFTTFESDEDTTLLLEASGHSLVYVNGVPRAGDPYGYGFVRVPVPIRKGMNEFLFVAGRGAFSAALQALPSEQPYFLGADDTLPTPVAGVPIESVIGVVVVNPGAQFAPSLAVEIRGLGDAQRTPLPPLPPHGVWKANIALRGSAPAAKGPLALELALIDASGASLATRPTSLSIVDPADRRVETFTSSIDGSAQSYAVVPQSGDPSAPRGLIVSLHGASVEATSQAAAYSPKDFASIVCPTNRRPFGFDWEDWGRLDAMEVLGHASRTLKSDPRRQWLTGHSMGGHGTWQIGAHFPDQFAAIAPSAGWISFRSYTGGAEFKSEGVEGVFQRAASPSDTLALKRNYAAFGVYILHGDADDNVPVQQARTMRGQLAGGDGPFHADFAYYERPGGSHWWGNECVDWPPLMRFLADRTNPDPASVDRIAFASAAPWVSSRNRWISIEQQSAALETSSVNIARDRGKRSYEGATTNVAMLTIRELPEGEGSISITLDGATVEAAPPASGELTLSREGDGWKVTESVRPGVKHAARGGPFKDAFRNRLLYVVGTAGDDTMDAALLAKARYDAETFWYRGNGAFEITLDSEFEPTSHIDRNVVLVGNADSNTAWSKLLQTSPVLVRNGSVKIGDREIAGDDLGCVFAYPRTGSDTAMVAVIAGTGLPGARLTERMPVFLSGVGYPDCTVFASDTLLKGLAGVRAAGFFGNDWSVEQGRWAEAAPGTP